MKTCPICGNAYADDRSRCPFCLTEDRPDFKTIPLPAAAKKMLLNALSGRRQKDKNTIFIQIGSILMMND